jgi:hypothetical protein
MTLIEEMIAAGRGLFALLIGRRDAPTYFNLTAVGLAGSFAAFLFAAAVHAYLPAAIGLDMGARPWQTFLVVTMLYVLQLGFSAIVLNQIGRLDGLVPYLVADNWATFFVTIVNVIIGLSGFGDGLTLLVIVVIAIIIEINIARLIVTLSPAQIAMFLIAQLLGVFAGLMAIGLILGPSVPVQ